MGKKEKKSVVVVGFEFGGKAEMAGLQIRRCPACTVFIVDASIPRNPREASGVFSIYI